MNRRIVTAIALCSTLYVATAVCVPTASAGNVAWGVSVGGPGFQVSTGQPGVYGPRYIYGAPYWASTRPYFRAYYRPYRPWLYPAAVAVPPVVYASAPIAYAPGPSLFHYSPR